MTIHAPPPPPATPARRRFEMLVAMHATLSQMMAVADAECAELRKVASLPGSRETFGEFVELGQALSLSRRSIERLQARERGWGQ